MSKTVPITRPTLPELSEIEPQLRKILRSGQLTNGEFVARFESEFAGRFGCRNAVAMSSCTDGLTWVLRHLPPGEVILPSFTFSATAHAVVLAGHQPVFADCEADTLNLDPSDIAARMNKNTRAVVATYIYGNPPEIDALQKLTRQHRVKLVLDSAHAVGASYRGKAAGNFGWAEVFSLTPTKQLCCGEGGMVTTADAGLVDFLRKARNYGNPGNYNTEFVGSNVRLAEFNAILGLAGLRKIDSFIKRRNELAELYHSRLSRIPGIGFPVVREGNVCSYKDYTVLIDAKKAPFSRAQLESHLQDHGIETRRYFNPAVHKHRAYRRWRSQATGLKRTEIAARRCLSLPMYSHLTAATAERIARAILAVAKL